MLSNLSSRLRHPTTFFPLLSLLILIALILLIFAPLRILVLCVGVILAALLAWAGPVWGVYLAVLSVPVQQLVVLPGGLSFTQAAVALMAAAWLLRTLAQPDQALRTGPLFWAWLGLLGALLLSASFTPYSASEALKAALRWIVAFFVWFVAVNSVQKRWQLVGLIVCLLAAPACTGLFGLWQFATGSGPPSFRITEQLPFVRAYGTIGQPNSFAGYMNMAWPFALALAVGLSWPLLRRGAQRVSWPLLGGSWLAAFATGAALLLSFSLGGWVGALVGAVGLLAALGRRWAVLALAGSLLLVLFLALGGTTLLPEAIAGRMTRLTGMLSFFDPSTVVVTPENFSLVERMAQMSAGLHMFLAYPWLGVGPGNYTLAYSDMAQAPWYASRGHAHNFYLHMAAETGVIGLCAYLTLMFASVVEAARALAQAKTGYSRAMLIGCCGTIAAIMGHNLFENLHVLNLGVQLSGIWAVATLLRRTTNGGQDESLFL